MRRLAVGLLFALAGCGNDPPSRHAGQLGAPCRASSDCLGGALCTTELAPDLSAAHFCYVPCPGFSPCPEGTFCQTRRYDRPGQQMLCVRECTDDASCQEVHPAFVACRVWSEVETQRSCGVARAR